MAFVSMLHDGDDDDSSAPDPGIEFESLKDLHALNVFVFDVRNGRCWPISKCKLFSLI